MTPNGSAEYANKQQPAAVDASAKTSATNQQQHEHHQPLPEASGAGLTTDVLLNNFQIKKKSYRVLLNGQHFVWECMQGKASSKEQQKQQKHQQQNQQQQAKESDSNIPTCYGAQSHVLHVADIISIVKGETKQASHKLPPAPTPYTNPQDRNSNDSAALVDEELASGKKPTAQYLTINYAERLLKSATDCNRWTVRRLTLYNGDPYIVRQWHAQLNARLLATGGRLRVQRLLVFINPYGGRKAGRQTYERHCKPLFQLAGIDVTCITTQRANQIRDILLTHDLSVYDAVCCVGGDGTVAEVINGLLFRTMRELGLDEQQPAYIPKPMLPVGVIPAGSTDTIAYSMHGTADVRTAAIHLVLGQRRGLDVCSVRNSSTLLRFCASVLSYGYLGDVAAKSEQYRWMGTKRYEYTGVKAFISNRGYEAELRLLLEESDDAEVLEDNNEQEPCASPASLQRTLSQSSVGDTSVCYANCKRCSFAASLQEPPSTAAFTETDDEASSTLPYDGLGAANGGKMAIVPLSSDETALLRARPRSLKLHASTSLTSSLNLGSVTSATTPAQWKCIRGKFFMICGANITCACSRSPNGISRYSHLGDGYLDLILVRKTSLLNNVRFLLNTAGRDGDIRNLPFVEVYRTRKFNFRTLAAGTPDENYSISGSCQPITQPADASNGMGVDTEFSSWNCDGEVVTDLDITMSSHCQLIDVFMRGPHSYRKANKASSPTLSSVPTTPASSSDNVYCCCHN